jgi:hypothetical protein
MKKVAVLLIAVGGLVSGCVAYDPYYQGGPGYRDGPGYRANQDRDRDGIPNRADRDRDGDGVRNSQDRRPDDARRY